MRYRDIFESEEDPDIILPKGVKLKVKHDSYNRTVTAHHHGKQIAFLDLERFGEQGKNNEAFQMATKPKWQKKGIMRALHQKAEKHFGKMNPSGALTDDGFAFWKKYRPEAVSGDLRFHQEKLIGKPINHPDGRPGTIKSVGPSGVSMQFHGSETTAYLRRNHVEHLLGDQK